MPGLTLLQTVLLLLAGSAITLAFVFLFLLYRRLTPQRPTTTANPFRDVMEMSILFQTMRGLVRDQKTLAREFNHSLDAKVEMVRDAIRQVQAGHEQLVRMQQEFRAQLEQAQGAVSHEGRQEPAGGQDVSPFHAIATPEETDFIEDWQAYGDEDEEEGGVEAEPEPPQQTAVAREAFRALLNMGETRDGDEHETEKKPAVTVPANGNGTGALRSRVYKYHDAGMSINAIAQELGVGKGEVRLMLSLRGK